MHARDDKRTGANNRILSDFGAIQNHRFHSNQCIPSHNTSVQDRTVTDVSIFFNNSDLSRETVNDAAILNICPSLDHDSTEISTKACTGTDIATRTNDDISDQHSSRMYIGRWVYDGCDTIYGITGHRLLKLFLIYNGKWQSVMNSFSWTAGGWEVRQRFCLFGHLL